MAEQSRIKLDGIYLVRVLNFALENTKSRVGTTQYMHYNLYAASLYGILLFLAELKGVVVNR
jgi:hypothetical protein